MIRNLSRVAAVLFMLASRASAQSTPVVLVHGFYSDSTTWSTTASYLSGYGYAPHTPSLDWQSHLFSQDTVLHLYDSTNAFGTGMILVGHSQGGLVARLSTRMDSVFGIITIGSPHQGAPIVNAGDDMAAYLAMIGDDSYTANAELADEDGCDDFEDPICDYAEDGLYYLSEAAYWGSDLLEIASYYAVLPFAPADLGDLAPGSSVISSLGTYYALERTANRISITVDDDDEDAGPLRLVFSAGTADPLAAAMYGYGFYTEWNALGIEEEDDPDEDDNYAEHQDAAYAMEELGYFVYSFSYYWNYEFTGSPDGTNDGLVPTDYQAMPNSATFSAPSGISHTEETVQYATIKGRLDVITGR